MTTPQPPSSPRSDPQEPVVVVDDPRWSFTAALAVNLVGYAKKCGRGSHITFSDALRVAKAIEKAREGKTSE